MRFDVRRGLADGPVGQERLVADPDELILDAEPQDRLVLERADTHGQPLAVEREPVQVQDVENLPL